MEQSIAFRELQETVNNQSKKFEAYLKGYKKLIS